MLKDKEVVSDPQRQYEIAREVHVQQHGGINKTTATIAEKFHWVRIKETVSLVIKNCPDCKEAAAKVPTFRLSSTEQLRKATNGASGNNNDPNSMIERIVTFDQMDRPSPPSPISRSPDMRALQEYNNTQQGYPDMPVDPQIMQQSGPQHHFVGGDGAFVAGGDGELQMRDVDMRMATERHVREGNEPLKWGHGDGRGAGEIDLEELLRRS